MTLSEVDLLYPSYTAYAYDVVNGVIPTSRYIQQSCERFFSWFERPDLEFRPEKVKRVVDFIHKLKHYTGAHNGKHFVLTPWQLNLVVNIFGWYHRGTDKRVIRNVYIEVGRKAGKSALISAICLYCLIADGENGAEVDCIANTRQQAKILFDMSVNFASSIDTRGKYIKPFRDKIKFNATKSFMQVLSSDAGLLDGFNASFFVQDELHAAKDSRLYDVLKSSQGMRTNPLSICITSAGFNKFSFCYQMRQTCIEILSGVKKDDTQYAAIYCLDEEDDWTDEELWVKANPNLDITVTRDYLREQVTQAKNNPSLEVGVRTKNFGQWVSTSDIWIDNDALLEVTENVSLDDFTTEDNCYVGVDLSAVSDLTAVSYMIPKDGKCYFKTDYYLPQSALSDNSNAEYYKLLKRRGMLKITPGNVVDYDMILKDLLEASQKVLIQKVAYDQYNATQWAINCTAQGLPLEPFSQALWHFNQATKGFERSVKMKTVVIDNNEITRWCFGNVTLKYDYNENVKPVKEVAQNKIDGVIAMLQAFGAYIEEPQYNNIIN